MANTEIVKAGSATDAFLAQNGGVISDGGSELSTTVESQRAIAEVQASFIMAIKRPRSESGAVLKMKEAVSRKSFAEKAYYAFPRAGQTVSGPSIGFAQEFARVWGNIRYGSRIIMDDEEKRTVEGWAMDLETNTYLCSQATFNKKQQRKNKTTQKTEWVTPDERDMQELTARNASKQIRNCILRLLPKDLVDDLVGAAKYVVAKNIQGTDIRKARIEVLAGFEKKGVTKEMLDAYIGKDFDITTSDDLADLTGILTGITEGHLKVAEIFSPVDGKSTTVKGKIDLGDITQPQTHTGKDGKEIEM